jgi:murein DD-endopeptidase MepM/ murein hydrolase activator NlpD
MNARWYVPGIGRFASADTIVPDPTNPQSYNRYSYVLNRVLTFTDPTGHRECGASEDCSDLLPSPAKQRTEQRKAEREFLSDLSRPADHQFGAFGGQRTVNCDGNCNQWIHPGRDTNQTNDSNLGDPIYAVYSGRVVKTGFMASTWDENDQRWRSALGEFIVISHMVGDETYYSIYAHMERGSTTVEERQVVAPGDVIGGMGSTAAQGTVHLHFEIRRSAAIDLSLNLPFVLPGNPGGNNYFPSNQEILRKYFLDISSLEW